MAAQQGAEGWVQISYVIDVEGNVQDPVVEDHSGGKGFKREALRAIKNWKFEPAIKDGKPTEQCHQGIQFDFTLEGVGGAKRSFIRNYKEAEALLNAKDIEAANKLLNEMHASKNINSYEYAWLWGLDSRFANEIGDDNRELGSIRRTIASGATHGSEDSVFKSDYTNYLYQRMFGLEVNLGRYGSALQTLDEIKELPEPDSLLMPLDAAIKHVTTFLASDENLFVNVDLGDEQSHFHLLARNDFAFTNINGQLDSVEVRCESRRQKFTVAEEFIWSIPESWGQCQVMIKGEKDTTFNLVEVGKV